MIRSNLRLLARAMIPGAKIQVIPDDVMDILLDEGVKDIASYTLCLKSNKKFDVVANQAEYNLSVEISDYLAVDKSGLWWNNGTTFKPVNPRTLKWLDINVPNWRNRSSGSPLNYSIDADILTVSPPPETALTDGFWLYYGKKPTPMTENDHYPFSGSTTEFTHLSIFDFAIILFVKMRLEPMLNKNADANLSRQEYLQEREEKKNLFYRRKDISSDNDTRMKA
jgi:hypothetical protein